MKFIDEARISIKSGSGGNGCVSFRREAHVEFGGPDGGNGGKGGDIILRAVSNLNTLIDYRFQQHFRAKNGESGKGKNRFGANAENITLDVPIGTQIFMEDGATLITDLDKEGSEITLLKGGDGGKGNVAFKSSGNQAPRKATKGEPCEEASIWIKLKIISDMGIIGLPNAGKSTLLSKISNAKPKIANYPFTTLNPELGVVYVDDNAFVMADIPGLIEDASLGTGLGHKFLKHIERCKAVLHLVDVTSDDVVRDYKIIRTELENYSTKLTQKDEIIALNKSDLADDEEVALKAKLLKKHTKQEIHIISAAEKQGLDELKKALVKFIKTED